MNELLKYADWLDVNVKDEQFDFNSVVQELYPDTNCGSICCGIGWLPAYTPRVKWFGHEVGIEYENQKRLGYQAVASNFFDIPYDDASKLFSPNTQDYIECWGSYPACGENCTVKELTDAIRHYVEIKS